MSHNKKVLSEKIDPVPNSFNEDPLPATGYAFVWFVLLGLSHIQLTIIPLLAKGSWAPIIEATAKLTGISMCTLWL